jgi:hypothetical protein
MKECQRRALWVRHAFATQCLPTDFDLETPLSDESLEDNDSLEEEHNVETADKKTLVLQSKKKKKKKIHLRKKTMSNSWQAIQFLKTFCAISMTNTLQAIDILNKLGGVCSSFCIHV